MYKCVFCVESQFILGFILSKKGIQVDPLKDEAILNLPTPSTLCQLQSLQGKEKNLCCFLPNYTKLTKVFFRILKKTFPFIWDDTAHKAFDALKNVLIHTPLLQPPNYHQDYFLYLSSLNGTITMVLF